MPLTRCNDDGGPPLGHTSPQALLIFGAMG
jgi:hypothetical protein